MEYLFKVLAKADAIHTPYQSGAQAATALIGNHIDLISVAQPDAAPLAHQGQLRVLAVSGARRSEALPEVPTLGEAGFRGFSASGWIALLVPAKTSPEIAAKLNAAVNDPAAGRRSPAPRGGRLRPTRSRSTPRPDSCAASSTGGVAW